jgi:hypothetical protein
MGSTWKPLVLVACGLAVLLLWLGLVGGVEGVRAQGPGGAAPAVAPRTASLLPVPERAPDRRAPTALAEARETVHPSEAVRLAPPGAIEPSNARLVQDLRDDDVRGNALAAMGKIRLRRRDPAHHLELAPLLENGLWVPDRQGRVLSALMLQPMTHDAPAGVPPHPVSRRLVEVTFECLFAEGGYPVVLEGRTGFHAPPRNSSIPFLLEHAGDLEADLVRLLLSNDPERSFVGAFVLARDRQRGYTDRIAPVLIDRLVDNWTRRDAMMSVAGLYALGPDVLAWTEPELPRDEQQRLCLEYLALAFRDPPAAERLHRESWALYRVLGPFDGSARNYTFRGYGHQTQ